MKSRIHSKGARERRIWKPPGYASAFDDKLSTLARPGGSKFRRTTSKPDCANPGDQSGKFGGGAMTLLQSRFPGTRRSVPRPSVKTTPRWETIIHQCRTKFAPTWTSQGGKQEYVRFGGAIVWFPNLLPPGQARVESLCNPTGTSIPTSSKVAHPKPVLETSNAQLQNAQARDLIPVKIKRRSLAWASGSCCVAHTYGCA